MTARLPIMLVHGFHGSVANWTESGFLDALIARGLDPALIHLFHYGYNEIEGGLIYDTEGDIRAVASRMSLRATDVPEDIECQIDRLSQKSVTAGGPPGVTLICHSMGGLVSRYYLSRTQADAFGTLYGGNVARVIQIGTPNLGVDLARMITLIPPDSIIWQVLHWFERLSFGKNRALRLLADVERQVEQLQLEAYEAQFGPRPRGYFDSLALRQITPGSEFLSTLNQPRNTPRTVEFHTIYGDIRFGVSVLWGKVPLWLRSVSFGDLLVSVYSAYEIPGTTPERYRFACEEEWTIRLGRPAPAARDFAEQYLPAVSHSNLLRNPAVQQTVGEILSASLPPSE
ncbi:MAG: alpha/beta fold hydrolase [Ardenticatenaceae bacterium]|nr:alpha/beta fold hydrolase [Ardenticatenaceae bacterium]